VFKRGFQNNKDVNENEPEYGTSLDPPLKEDATTGYKKKSSMPKFKGWDEEVASRSEADIKADQNTQSMEEMKKQTIKTLQKNQKKEQEQQQAEEAERDQQRDEEEGIHAVRGL